MTALIIGILTILVVFYYEKANREKYARIIKEQKNLEENKILKEKLNQANHEKKILNFIDMIKLHQLKLVENCKIDECKIRIEDFSKEFDDFLKHTVSKKILYTYIKINKEDSYRLITIIEKSLLYREMEIIYEIFEIIDSRNHKKIKYSIKIDDTTQKNEKELWDIFIKLSEDTENKMINLKNNSL